MNWRLLDTLFVRLFLLMWLVLGSAHFVAFSVVNLHLGGGGAGSAPPGGGPGGPAPAPGREPPPGGPPSGPGGPPGMPTLTSLPPPLPGMVTWLDYGLRALVIGLGALLGARWLSAPMRRLAGAADALAEGLGRGRPPPLLDERTGTREVRGTARVFNTMASRLQEQFDARGLQMAAVSHDLRTPLARLRLRLEALPPALAEAAVADIHEMDELIGSTLAVLREQREGGPPRALELRSLLQAMADDLAAGGADVALADGPPLRALAHPAALRRVVGNLLDNAVRYGVRARLALAAVAEGVEITIDDDGPGIPPGQLEAAFQPWVRLPGASASRPGHGLGLAIARDLAERDGARLDLANRAGGGLRARLLLPAAPNVSAPKSTP